MNMFIFKDVIILLNYVYILMITCISKYVYLQTLTNNCTRREGTYSA